jgi:hypothetical protein
MAENGIAAGCVSARAGTVRAKASAARTVSGIGQIRRRRGMEMELLPDMPVVFTGVKFLFCIHNPFLHSAFEFID